MIASRQDNLRRPGGNVVTSDEVTGNPAIRAQVPAAWNEITRRIIEAAMEVHSQLGLGYLESIYEEALCHEFGLRGIRFERQTTFRVPYKEILLREQRLDLLVEGLVIVENKAVEAVEERALATMLGYMKALGIPLGLLINFNTLHLREGIYRRINSRAVIARTALLPHSPPPPSPPSSPSPPSPPSPSSLSA